MSNVGEVRNDLLSRISNATKAVIVDLGQVTYLDSKGVHLLVQLHERLQRGSQNMRIVCSPDSLLHQLLLVSRLPIPMDDTVEAAVARAQAPPAI
jgi:anti-anti-sigma factor